MSDARLPLERRDLVWAVVIALGIFALIDRLPAYERHGGPLLVVLGPGLGIHVGDLLVLGAVVTAIITWRVRRLRDT